MAVFRPIVSRLHLAFPGNARWDAILQALNSYFDESAIKLEESKKKKRKTKARSDFYIGKFTGKPLGFDESAKSGIQITKSLIAKKKAKGRKKAA